jgi:hypothetical protein
VRQENKFCRQSQQNIRQLSEVTLKSTREFVFD